MRYRLRLERLERAWRPADLGPAVLVVFPDDWPAADRDAFDAGDPSARAAVVERHTGHPADRAAVLFVVVPSRAVGA